VFAEDVGDGAAAARLLISVAVRFLFPSRRLVAILPGMMAIQFARRVMLALVVIALIGSAAGPRADAPLAAPESVGFSADGSKTLQRTMRALVDGQLASADGGKARHDRARQAG